MIDSSLHAPAQNLVRGLRQLRKYGFRVARVPSLTRGERSYTHAAELAACALLGLAGTARNRARPAVLSVAHALVGRADDRLQLRGLHCPHDRWRDNKSL